MFLALAVGLYKRCLFHERLTYLGIIGTCGSGTSFDCSTVFDAEGIVDYLISAARGMGAECSGTFGGSR